jgi:hypothetical protein
MVQSGPSLSRSRHISVLIAQRRRLLYTGVRFCTNAHAACVILLLSSALSLVVSSFVRPKFSRMFQHCSLSASTPPHELRSDSTTTTFVRQTESISTSSSRATIGNWEEIHGNYLLRPKVEGGPPLALLHFLGGAIVGHSPHIFYRYMLERLASKGYLVVATPYNLSFDYLTTCDNIISRFERIATPLARTYGALPVVGIGHSCGSLLQLLITSLFPDKRIDFVQ